MYGTENAQKWSGEAIQRSRKAQKWSGRMIKQSPDHMEMVWEDHCMEPKMHRNGLGRPFNGAEKRRNGLGG